MPYVKRTHGMNPVPYPCVLKQNPLDAEDPKLFEKAVCGSHCARQMIYVDFDPMNVNLPVPSYDFNRTPISLSFLEGADARDAYIYGDLGNLVIM